MDPIFSMLAGGLLFAAGVLLGARITHRSDSGLSPMSTPRPQADITEPEDEQPREDEDERAEL